MASVVSLIQFTQGSPGIAGQALVGTAGTLVTVANNDNTNVNSWQVDLVYTPPFSTVLVAVPLAFSDNGSTPAASFTPDVAGSYRIVVTVWAIINRTGNNYDVDIRNFVVPLPNGSVMPSYQKDPDKLPTIASGRPGAKPNEMNINGTELGWAGDGTDGLLNATIVKADSGGGGGALTPPVNPTDDGKIPKALGGDFTYLAGNAQDDVLAWDTALGWISTPRAGFQITSFNIGTSLLEVSQTLVTPAFTAAYNVAPTTAVLTDNNGNPPKNVIGSPTSFTSNGTFVKNTFGAVVTFTLTATIGGGPTAKTTTLTWGQKNHWGVDVAGQTGGAFILALAGSHLSTSRNESFTVSASPTEKVYFACRTAYGTPTFKDHSTGFALAITKSGDFSVTNAFGFVENFQLWESDNLGLGFPGTFTTDVT